MAIFSSAKLLTECLISHSLSRLCPCLQTQKIKIHPDIRHNTFTQFQILLVSRVINADATFFILCYFVWLITIYTCFVYFFSKILVDSFIPCLNTKRNFENLDSTTVCHGFIWTLRLICYFHDIQHISYLCLF